MLPKSVEIGSTFSPKRLILAAGFCSVSTRVCHQPKHSCERAFCPHILHWAPLNTSVYFGDADGQSFVTAELCSSAAVCSVVVMIASPCRFLHLLEFATSSHRNECQIDANMATHRDVQQKMPALRQRCVFMFKRHGRTCQNLAFYACSAHFFAPLFSCAV